MWFDHLPWNTIPWLTRILLGKRWSPCWNLHLQPDEQTSRSSGHSNNKNPMWPMQDKPWRRLDLFSSLPLPFWHPLSKITPQSSNRIHLGKYYSQFPNHWNYSYLFFFFLSTFKYPLSQGPSGRLRNGMSKLLCCPVRRGLGWMDRKCGGWVRPRSP